jgi:hypothetical protein
MIFFVFVIVFTCFLEGHSKIIPYQGPKEPEQPKFDLYEVRDERFEIEHLSSFDQLAEFIDSHDIVIVAFLPSFDNERLIQEYLRTVQNRLKGKSPHFKGGIFSQK